MPTPPALSETHMTSMASKSCASVRRVGARRRPTGCVSVAAAEASDRCRRANCVTVAATVAAATTAAAALTGRGQCCVCLDDLNDPVCVCVCVCVCDIIARS